MWPDWINWILSLLMIAFSGAGILSCIGGIVIAEKPQDITLFEKRIRFLLMQGMFFFATLAVGLKLFLGG